MKGIKAGIQKRHGKGTQRRSKRETLRNSSQEKQTNTLKLENPRNRREKMQFGRSRKQKKVKEKTELGKSKRQSKENRTKDFDHRL